MRAVLLDTGPIVAFLKADDVHHAWAREVFGQLRPPLLSCEPVLSEAVYLLRGVPKGAEKIFELVRRGVVQVDFRLSDEVEAVAGLIRRYGGGAMDLADACLVRMAERRADCAVFTVDGQFRDVYRRNGRQTIPTLLPVRARTSKARRRGW